MITYEVNRAELELVEKKLGDMKSKAPPGIQECREQDCKAGQGNESRKAQKEPIQLSRSDSIVT